MSNVAFSTPISYANNPRTFREKLSEKIDEYLYIRGPKAYVIGGHPDKIIYSYLGRKSSKIATALKIASYILIFLPILALCAKRLLRTKRTFEVISPEEELKKGVVLSPAHIRAFEEILPSLRVGMDDARIQWITNNPAYGLSNFKILQYPELTFKMIAHSDSFESSSSLFRHFDYLKEVQEACLVFNLNLLKLPKTALCKVTVRGTEYSMLVSETLNYNPLEGAQQELYKAKVHNFQNTAKQLATLFSVIRTKNVKQTSIPILEESVTSQNDCKVGLADIISSHSYSSAFEWTPSDSGFITCLFSEKQMKEAIQCAKHFRVELCGASLWGSGYMTMAMYDHLMEFYQKNNLLADHRRPLNVDINTLGLNPEEEVDFNTLLFRDGIPLPPIRIPMAQAANAVISMINYKIQHTPDSGSIRDKRNIKIHTFNNEFIFIYRAEGRDMHGHLDRGIFRKIIEMLKLKKYIFSYKIDSVNTIVVQA